MTISEILRRAAHDRITVRAYLAGQRSPGTGIRAVPNPFDKFVDYVTARLTEAPHLRSATLLDELRPLGFTRPYPTLTRHIWDRGLQPECTPRAHATRAEASNLCRRHRECARLSKLYPLDSRIPETVAPAQDPCTS